MVMCINGSVNINSIVSAIITDRCIIGRRGPSSRHIIIILIILILIVTHTTDTSTSTNNNGDYYQSYY